ncbi:MAG: hypothetical protein H7Z14_06515 [Anaerolineae bacterium]|nr:hypothetical protein [Phycisphaerae bacterium]
MNFFIHPNFWPEAAKLLRAADSSQDIELFEERYEPGTPDDVWLPCLGKQRPRPFVVSMHDGMIRNAVERRALKQSGCSFVYFSQGWADIPWEEFRWRFLKAWPQIVDAAQASDRQAVFEVTLHGKPRRVPL